MSVTQKLWNKMVPRAEVVALNTLALHQAERGMPPLKARVGVVLSTLPLMDGTVNMQVQARDAAGTWQQRWFIAKSKTISVLDGKRRQAVIDRFNGETLNARIKGLGKGFDNYLGCDPEIFLANDEGKIVPAWEALPDKGTGPVFWDGVQGEFTTGTERCLAWFLDHVHIGLHKLYDTVKPKGLKLHLADVIEVPLDMLQTETWEHVRLGCDPSKNAYNDCGNLEVDSRQLQIRFAGGHKHFNLPELDEVSAIRMVKALDAIWGVMSVSLFDGFENPLRRAYYGRAGEYRLPRHGLEYRTPSNAWLCHPAIAQISWTIARQALGIGRAGYIGAWRFDENEVRRVINELDVAGARKILKNNEKVLKLMFESYFKENHSRIATERYEVLRPIAVKQALRVIMEGAFGVLESPKDVVKNWMLEAPTGDDKWERGEEHRGENRWILHSESDNKQWIIAAEAIERGEKI